ncbi:MAG: HNH endonuclease [Halobacteriota archaeon]
MRTILDGGTIDGHCDFCATPLRRWPGDIKGDRGYCNRQCQTGGFSEAYIAEGHPNWAGGGNRNYGKGWRRAKLDTLERDGYRCVRCGTSDEEMGRNPDVHGIIPVRLFDESPNHEITDAHFPANLASLCVTHHRRADHGRFRPKVPWDAIGANVSLVDDRVPDAAVDYVTRYDFLAAN